MSETPAPAPLPPEEIEQLKVLRKTWQDASQKWHVACQNGASEYQKRKLYKPSESALQDYTLALIGSFGALLAEIEAGRAGAERVRALENALRIVGASDKVPASIRHVANRAIAGDESIELNGAAKEAAANAAGRACTACDGEGTVIVSDDGRSIETACCCDCEGTGWIAALRPADGAQDVCKCCGGTKELRFERVKHPCPYCVPAAPAQVGAQPAGRVEAPKKTLAELQAELADVERQISECTSWGAGLAALDEWRRDLKRDIARATPPTAGAGDGQENGR
jgi:hypothetical protein